MGRSIQILNRQQRAVLRANARGVRRDRPPAVQRKRHESGQVKTINLITRDNGVGLSTDMELLERVLIPAGFDVQRVPYNCNSMRPCDLAIFLELYNPTLARYADSMVGVFNLEWFASAWERHLNRFDQLWAKSLEAVEVYSRMGLTSRFTGFSSRDLYDPTVKRSNGCFHLRGHSGLKNTEAILEAWRQDPDLPHLTVISAVRLQVPNNVTLLGRISHEELVVLMNANPIHLCPSRSEGWGHYITEGMSTGATVITTDASPMNEHINADRGVLIPSIRQHTRWKVKEHDVDPQHLIDAVHNVIGWPKDKRITTGNKAREFVIQRNAQFETRVLEAIKELLGVVNDPHERDFERRDGDRRQRNQDRIPADSGDRFDKGRHRKLPAGGRLEYLDLRKVRGNLWGIANQH